MISVIVPVYNLENYIERTLDSILAQTYKDIEIIVVDDGSNDNTGVLIDGYQLRYSDKVSVLHIPNSGVTKARLSGVKVARGDWIGFCDGDDYIEPDMYERLIDNAGKYQAKISHCGYQMVFYDGRVNYFYNTGRLVQQDTLTGLKDLLAGSFIEPGLCNKLFHKTLFHSLLHDDVIDLTIKNNEDLLMNYILFSCADKSVYEDFCPYHYIVRQGSASRKSLSQNKIFDPIRVKGYIVELAPNEIKTLAQCAYLRTCINTYSSLIGYAGKDFEKEKKEVRRLIIDRKADIQLLNFRQKILANLIRFMPSIYPFLYRIYSNHFQENKYV